MAKMFWGYFHSFMMLILFAIWVITEIEKSGKEIGDSLKNSESKSKRSAGETIMLLLIVFAIVFSAIWLILNVALKNSTIAT